MEREVGEGQTAAANGAGWKGRRAGQSGGPALSLSLLHSRLAPELLRLHLRG